jgi:hypothetical protein
MKLLQEKMIQHTQAYIVHIVLPKIQIFLEF